MPTQFQDVNILIVDDDDIDVRGIKRQLSKQKIANPVYVASDGVEAFEMLRGDGCEPIPQPYLILLDLNMPRMDGLQFLKELREDPELTQSIVFVLTTSALDEDKVSAYEHHIAGYLLKSEAGPSFLKVVQMLENFVLTVQFPPQA